VVSSQTQCSGAEAPVDFSQAEHEFLYVMTGKKLDSCNLKSACGWYTSFLECKILEAWDSLFRPLLVTIDASAAEPSSRDIEFAFQFLTAVALECRHRRNLALTDIVDKLYNDGLLRDTDDDRSEAYQLVFASIGWISK
jgi:hypothetical protein